MSGIHPKADVSPGARVGADVEIGPYAVVEEDATIGDGCFIGPHVHIGRHTVLGEKCQVYYGANIDAPQDYRWRPGVVSRTVIGPRSTIREYVTIHRPPDPGRETVVGADCFLMAFVHIGHHAFLEDKVTLANHATMAGYVHVGRGAVVSGFVLAHQFSRIGALAMVAPGVKLRQDVPPFCLCMENGYIYGPNVVGLRRAGLDHAARSAVKKAIKTYYFSGLKGSEALDEIESWNTTPEQDLFAAFIRGSKRGVVSGRLQRKVLPVEDAGPELDPLAEVDPLDEKT